MKTTPANIFYLFKTQLVIVLYYFITPGLLESSRSEIIFILLFALGLVFIGERGSAKFFMKSLEQLCYYGVVAFCFISIVLLYRTPKSTQEHNAQIIYIAPLPGIIIIFFAIYAYARVRYILKDK